jgi:hypothetical protein
MSSAFSDGVLCRWALQGTECVVAKAAKCNYTNKSADCDWTFSVHLFRKTVDYYCVFCSVFKQQSRFVVSMASLPTCLRKMYTKLQISYISARHKLRLRVAEVRVTNNSASGRLNWRSPRFQL